MTYRLLKKETKMKQVIIINGYGGVGKDTFVNFCANRIATKNYSSVTEIKKIAQLLDWDGGKTEKDRKFLSDLKLLATEYSDFPFRCISKQIDNFMKQNEYELLFIHIRDIPEIKRVVEKYPFVKTLLITNSNVQPITSNVADANVMNYNYTYTIDNSYGLEDLDTKSEAFLQLLSIASWVE